MSGWSVSGCVAAVFEDELTATGVNRVLGLRGGKVGLVDAILSIDKLADHAAGAMSRSTVGGEGEIAVFGQHAGF